MTRLMEVAQSLKADTAVSRKSVMASSDLGISKNISVRWLSSNDFYRVMVPIAKLPLLAGDMIASSDAPKHMIVVDVNKNKVNRSTVYVPKITVVCGADMVKGAKKNGLKTVECWVGAKAAKALKIKLPKIEANLGVLSKLGFNPNPDTAKAPAQGAVNLPRTGFNRSINFPNFRDFGPPGSELNNPQFMSMLNVEEALNMYLLSLKDGIWKPISSQWAVIPPSLVNATNEAGMIAKDKKIAAFAPLDFVLWQQQQLEAPVKTKYVNGKKLFASRFAFVGDQEDPSTWLFRADSMESIKASVNEAVKCKYLSKEQKTFAINELKRRSTV